MFQLMEINVAQYFRIELSLPRQRSNTRLSNRQVLNTILFVAKLGCKWHGLLSFALIGEAPRPLVSVNTP